MKKWVKLNGNKVVEMGLGDNEKLYKKFGYQLADVEESEKGGWYIAGTAPKYTEEEVLTAAIDKKIAELKNYRNIEEESAVLYREKYWDFDSKSRDRINAALVTLVANNIASINWTSADDTSLELSSNDLSNIISIAASRGNRLHTKYRELRDQARNAVNLDDLNDINW